MMTTDAKGPDRTRSYTWQAPEPTAAAAGARSGMEVLTAMRDGELPSPPIGATMGMTGLEVEPGRVVFTLEPQEWHYNPLGTVHGGVHATPCWTP